MLEAFSLAEFNATTCQRCGRQCVGADGSPDARLLKRAQTGVCVDCGITLFLQSSELPFARLLTEKPDEPDAHTLASGKGKKTAIRPLSERGRAMLAQPHVQAQFAAIMRAGQADAQAEEIDWTRVVDNWELPAPKPLRKSREEADHA